MLNSYQLNAKKEKELELITCPYQPPENDFCYLMLLMCGEGHHFLLCIGALWCLFCFALFDFWHTACTCSLVVVRGSPFLERNDL